MSPKVQARLRRSRQQRPLKDRRPRLGSAAGALLVMLIDSMIPEAYAKGKRASGLATVLGFAVAAGLNSVS